MVKIDLGNLKVPLIAAYITGFIVSTVQISILEATEPIIFTGSPLLQTPIIPLLWMVSWVLGIGNPIQLYLSATIVGVLTWFALRK